MRRPDIRPVRPQLDEPSLISAAIAKLSRADATGLQSGQITYLDDSASQGLEQGMTEAGIGQTLLTRLQFPPHSDPVPLSDLLKKISEALDQSPVPADAWRTLQELLGLVSLVRLLGISHSSARRYWPDRCVRPDAVGGRPHIPALVVGHLAGACNSASVRRRLDRKRRQLDNDAKPHALGEGWPPDDDGPCRVRGLARAPSLSPAT